MRRLLLRYGLGMTSVVLVAFLVPLGLLARSLAEDRALDAAREAAQRVAVFAGGATQDDAQLEAMVLAANTGGRETTVYLPGGTVVGPTTARTPAVELASFGRAASARVEGGVEVVQPVGGADGVAVVRTFVPDAELTAGVAQGWLVLAGVGLVLLAGTVVVGDRIAGRLSRSVRDLADTAERLGSGDLSARVRPSGPPEVVSVGRVLNGLGLRVATLVEAERETIADLSHRLRTPITALRLDADLLEDPEDRRRISDHVDALVAAVDAVVRSARQPSLQVAGGRCDAAAVVRDRAQFWGVLATDQGRRLAVDVPGEVVVVVGVASVELGAALDVLVDNVFSHTPAGTGFRLAVEDDGAVVRVSVEDDGPGLAGRADLAERGVSGAGSTGLGLDVARRTAEAAGGRMVLGAGARGGAQVVLELPRA